MKINKQPNTWTKQDLHNAALMIKNHPEDKELKEQFFNLMPESEENYNRQLSILIKNAYKIHVQNKGITFDKDEFSSITAYYLCTKNFSDWNPQYSLSTYLHMLLRSNGPLGSIITEEAKRNNATISIDKELEENPNLLIPSLITSGFTDDLEENHDLNQLLNSLLPILHITRDELTLYLVINHRLINDSTLISVNSLLNTNYTRLELQLLSYKITRKIKQHKARAQAYINIWRNK